MRVLVVVAHADDETLSMGGTISRLATEGREMHVCVLGEGHSARKGLVEDHDGWVDQAKAAARILGAKLWVSNTQGFPDNRFDTLPLIEIACKIEEILQEVQPDTVYTHHGGDCNQDHRAVYQATLIATRPVEGCSVKEVYAYEVPSSTEWAFNKEGAFMPNTFVDISGEYLEKKIRAMEMYESERRTFPHPRSPEALRALATWRGAQSGLMAAEAFELVRSIR